MPVTRARFALCVLGMFPTSVFAAADVAVHLGVGASDNIGRSAQNEVNGTLYSAGLLLSLSREGRRSDAALTADIAFLHYSKEDFDSSVIGNLTGTASVELVEDLLRWTVQDEFGQTRRDLLSSQAPDNREIVNFVSTGPDVSLRLGTATSLQLQARYGRMDYEFSPLSSQRHSLLAGLERRLSASSSAGLFAVAEHLDPTSGAAEEFDRQEAFLRFGLQGSRSNVGLELGGTRIKGDSGSDSGLLLRTELGHQFGQRSSLTFHVARQFADAGGTLGAGDAAGSDRPGRDAMTLARTTDPYSSDMAGLSWQIGGRRTSIMLSASWLDENASGAAGDRERLGYELAVDRQLSSRIATTIAASYADTRFSAVGSTYEFSTTVRADWRLSRRLLVAVEGRYNNYAPASGGPNARERQLWIRLQADNLLGTGR